MAFDNTVLQEHADLPAGEFISASPYNVSAFEVFENGLVSGRFAKFDTASIDNLDGSATPVIAGIVKRKITGEISSVDQVYSTTGDTQDSVAEVINFGFATVTVTDAATPAKYGTVQVINDGTADAGKATDAAVAAGIISAGDVTFWEQKAANVWLVRINKYL